MPQQAAATSTSPGCSTSLARLISCALQYSSFLNKVQLNCDEDEYLKFLDFIRRSKECGHEYVHLIIPNIENERNHFHRISQLHEIRRGENELNLRNLSDLFSVTVDCRESSRIEEALRSSSAHIVLPPHTAAYQEPSSKRQGISSSYGMLDVKRISGGDLPQLLANGSPVLIPTEDGNYLSMSFSKDYAYTPYRFFLWQNGEEESRVPKYQCREMKIPVCVENNGICISDESKNLLADVVTCGQNIKQKVQESEQRQDQDNCAQSQLISQQEVYGQQFPRHRLEPQASFLPDSQFQNSAPNITSLRTEPDHKHEEDVPAWFYRHMEKFKEDLVADIKKDVMENVKQILSTRYDQPKARQEILLKNQENTLKGSCEEVTPQRDVNKTKEDWEVVKGFPNDETSENSIPDADYCNQLKKAELDAVRDLELENKFEFESSNCVSDECYDSDSSVSIILDDRVNCDDDVSADSLSSFIKIPRCFVTESKNAHESGLASVPIRLKKHRTSKMMTSTVNTTEIKISPERSLSCTPSSSWQDGTTSKSVQKRKLTTPMTKSRRTESEIEVSGSSSFSPTKNNIEMSPGDRKQIAAHSISGGRSPMPSLPQNKEQDANISGTGTFSWKPSGSADTENTESKQTQPLNILPNKVFELTNNVFKNVLNSVKIPHSNEVKESVQKVFEDSMTAASRLIPNPLNTGTVPFPENSNVSFTNPTAKKDVSLSTSASDVTVNLPSAACTNENDYVSRLADLPDKVKADLMLLNEMGFVNNGHNLFLLTKYPDDIEKIVESLVNFTVF